MFNNNAWPDHDDGQDKDERNDVMARRDEEEKKEPAIGPVKGDFVAPPEVMEQDEASDALPSQEEFWRPPTRFGSVPVEKEPWAGIGAGGSENFFHKSCCRFRWLTGCNSAIPHFARNGLTG